MNLFSSFVEKPWLEAATIFLTKHGSHAYGLNTPTSDLDVKGVAIPPIEYFFGCMNQFQQAESKSPTDLVIYDIRKFIALAVDCNPSIIEVLWTDESDWLKITPIGELLVLNRDLFISTKARHTFSGYAISQLGRIDRHYRWLKNPPKAKPERTSYGLPERTVIPKDQLAAAEAAIKKRVEEWELDLEKLDEATRIHVQGRITAMLSEISATSAVLRDPDTTQWRVAAELVGYDTNFIELLDRERRYRSVLKDWDSYQTWKETRNPARAALEEKFGYDTKHALHLVRLLRMCAEILQTGKVQVKRPDRDELLAIRAGAWSYEALVEWAAKQDQDMNVLYAQSKLPREAPKAQIDALCVRMVQARFGIVQGIPTVCPL